MGTVVLHVSQSRGFQLRTHLDYYSEFGTWELLSFTKASSVDTR